MRLCPSPALAAALLLTVAAAPAVAQGVRSREAARAQDLIEQGEFESAVRTIDRALSAPTLSEDEQVELYRLLGLAHLYLGEEERARQAYERLLQARPDFELPATAPPKIRALYARIKEDVKRRRLKPVTVTTEPPREAPASRPFTVDATIENLAPGTRAKLHFRRAGAQAYSSVDFVRDPKEKDPSRFRASIPAYELPGEGRPYELELYVEVADAAQRRLAGRGDPLNPLILKVSDASSESVAAAPSAKPWFHSPWVWAGAGVVVAGAVTGAVLIATSRSTGELPIVIRVGP